MTLAGWDLNGSTGSGKKNNFTKFPEGITRIRILSDRPHMRWAHWMPQFQRKITCPGFGCPIDEIIKSAKANKTATPYNSTRDYSLVIYNLDKNQREIMQEGVTMFEVLKDAIEEATAEHPGSDISSFVFKIRKKMSSATGKNTWTVTSEAPTPLSDEESTAKIDMPNFMQLFAPPTIDQVHELLNAPTQTKEIALENYNRIMGYTQQQEQQEDSDLGVVVE